MKKMSETSQIYYTEYEIMVSRKGVKIRKEYGKSTTKKHRTH